MIKFSAQINEQHGCTYCDAQIDLPMGGGRLEVSTSFASWRPALVAGQIIYSAPGTGGVYLSNLYTEGI